MFRTDLDGFVIDTDLTLTGFFFAALTDISGADVIAIANDITSAILFTNAFFILSPPSCLSHKHIMLKMYSAIKTTFIFLN